MNTSSISSLFSPQPPQKSASSSRALTTSFTDKITYYVISRTSTEEEKLAFAGFIIMCGTNRDALGKAWKCWVSTYVMIITPGFEQKVNRNTYVRVELPRPHLEDLLGLMRALGTALDSGIIESFDSALSAVRNFSSCPGLPKIDQETDFTSINGEFTSKIILCHYAIMLFLAGKRLDGSDHSQASSRHPLALRGKAHIDEPCSFLEGSARISDHGHLQINNAWSEMSHLRSIVFREYSTYNMEKADFAKDIIWTTMHLLRFSNMAHAIITNNFLQAYPWAKEVPALKSSIAIYMQSVRAAAAMDSRLFPFVKLIQGDKSGIFPRKDMEPLIACAVATLEQSNTTLSDFYRTESFNSIVEVFLAEKQRREVAGEAHDLFFRAERIIYAANSAHRK